MRDQSWEQKKRTLGERLLQVKLLRFVLVGGLNTAFSFGIYVILLHFGFPYPAANGIAMVLGIAFSFHMHGRFVFGNKGNRLIFRYVASWAIIYGLNLILIEFFVRRGLNPYGAGGAALLPIVGLSFVVQKMFVFSGQAKATAVQSKPPDSR